MKVLLVVEFIVSYTVWSVQTRSFLWFVFFCIRTEYGDLRSKSPYSLWIQENTDQKKLRISTLFTQCIKLQYQLKTMLSISRIKLYLLEILIFFSNKEAPKQLHWNFLYLLTTLILFKSRNQANIYLFKASNKTLEKDTK